MKRRSNDTKRRSKDTKKTILMKWKLLIFTKNATRQRQLQRHHKKDPKSRYHLFLREQPDVMTGKDRKNYRSIVPRRWKEIKEDPTRLSEYNDRTRQMQNEAEELQNEKTMVDRPTAKNPKKAPKTPEFVDTDSDDTDNEQGSASKQLKKTLKTPEFFDTNSDDTDDEQERQPQKASKTSEYTDNEQEPAVKCIVMYSSEDEQEPAIKKLQKASKISNYLSTEDEQGPTAKQPQKSPKILGSPASVKPAKIPKFVTAGCTHILTSGIRKAKQCRFRASDEAGKFCHHHKQT